ncbi:MAG: DMT family transporter [bacterium]
MTDISASSPPKASLQDWGLLLSLVLLGGTSFSAIRIAVETAEPAIVSAGRLWVAAIILLAYSYYTGRHLPVIYHYKDKKVDKRWAYMLACGVIGYTIPFFLFPWAQRSVPSMLAGIYMAFMPLATVIMARLFAEEPLGLRKGLGFVIGTMGVLMLIGPAALTHLHGSDLFAQMAIVGAVMCYSAYAVITRRAPAMPARSFAAGMLLCAAVAATPLAFFSAQDWSLLSGRSIAAIIFLGLFPSGLAAILIIVLIQRIGAGFMSMANYMTPIIAIISGMLIFQEPLKSNFLIGLIIIFTGLAITQSQQYGGIGRGLINLSWFKR